MFCWCSWANGSMSILYCYRYTVGIGITCGAVIGCVFGALDNDETVLH